ncbi:MAG: FAD-dependent oxidoreductase, partial [Butyricicoccaceae bacterium]
MMKRLVLLALACVMLMCCEGCVLAENAYTPGSYTAAAKGMGGDVNVTVNFSENAIISIEVGENSETPGISDTPIERIPAMIVEHQSLAVDAVAGATMTSNAILTAVAACVEQAGGDVEALKAVEVVVDAEDRKLEADVVIIGAGASGCSAALHAADQGLKVVLLEKQASAGGEAILSGGIVYATGSKAQLERGLSPEDTPADLADYWLSVEPDANYDLLLEIAERSGSTIDWMSELGVRFDPVLKAQGLDTVDRGLTAADQQGGAGLMKPLIEKINESENITLLLETRGQQILMDDQNKVCGAVAQAANGGRVEIAAPAVIICTNNIDGSSELLAQYHPAFADYAKANSPFTGDGQIMAREVGAKIEVIENQFVGAVMPIAGLQVNINGDRFTNEAGFYNVIWDDLLATTGDIENLHPIMIIDSGTMETNTSVQRPMQDGKLYTWKMLVEKGFDPDFKFATAANGVSYKADTLEELAQMIGVPYDHLQASVDRYNELYALGEDVDFGKPAEYLYEIKEGPFYAYDEGLMVCYFSCGIAVDLD